MPRKIQQDLPKSQSVYINDKVLWELIRIFAGKNNIPITFLIEIGMKFFLTHDDKDTVVARAKLFKELENVQR